MPVRNRPKAVKKPGNPPRVVPGRKSEVRQIQSGKWIFQFRRNDFEDIQFDTQAEAMDYMRYIKNASLKIVSLRVK